MSLLTNKSTFVERDRGLVLWEDFENETEFYNNDGITIGANATINKGLDSTAGGDTWVDYAASIKLTEFTFIFEDLNFALAASNNAIAGHTTTAFQIFWTGAGNLAVTSDDSVTGIVVPGVYNTGQNYFLAVTADGSNLKAYIDDNTALSTAFTETAFTFNRIFAKNAGSSPTEATLRRCKVFNRCLNADEIENYRINSKFTYDENLKYSTPMTLETYDPTNSLLLDRSKYGLNAELGNAGAGKPTKLLNKRGYSFNSDRILIPDNNTIATDTMTIQIALKPDVAATAGILDKSSGGVGTAGPFYVWARASEAVRFYISDGLTSQNVEVSPANYYQYFIVLFTLDANNLTGYVNGQYKAQAARTVGTLLQTSNPLVIGAMDNAGTLSYTGEIYDVKIYDKVLSLLQIKDLYYRTIEEINRI